LAVETQERRYKALVLGFKTRHSTGRHANGYCKTPRPPERWPLVGQVLACNRSGGLNAYTEIDSTLLEGHADQGTSGNLREEEQTKEIRVECLVVVFFVIRDNTLNSQLLALRLTSLFVFHCRGFGERRECPSLAPGVTPAGVAPAWPYARTQRPRRAGKVKRGSFLEEAKKLGGKRSGRQPP
jgi:hypothetical protein